MTAFVRDRLWKLYPFIPRPIDGRCTVCPRPKGSDNACACYDNGWQREFAVLEPEIYAPPKEPPR